MFFDTIWNKNIIEIYEFGCIYIYVFPEKKIYVSRFACFVQQVYMCNIFKNYVVVMMYIDLGRCN